MFNYRILLAGKKEDIAAIVSGVGLDPASYKKTEELESVYGSNFLRLAVWFDVRNIPFDNYYEKILRGINNKTINPNIVVRDKFVRINDKEYRNILELTEYLDGPLFMDIGFEKQIENISTSDVPVAESPDGSIKIYKINSADDGRRLVGEDTSWCIGRSGASNMWQGYRDTTESTFYIVFDENPPSSNQRKVAIDYTRNGILITDIPNNTGKYLSNEISFELDGEEISGSDIPTYFAYLKSKGIDLDQETYNPVTGEMEKVFKNDPLTFEDKLYNHTLYYSYVDLSTVTLWSKGYSYLELDKNKFYLRDFENSERNDEFIKELKEQQKNGNYNAASEIDDLYDGKVKYDGRIKSNEFEIIKNPDAKFYLSRYIGQGQKLDDDVFDLLISTKNRDLLSKYANNAINMPPPQAEKLKNFSNNIFSSYVRNQIIAWEQGQVQAFQILYLAEPNGKFKDEILRIAKGKRNFESGIQKYGNWEKIANINLDWFKYPEIFELVGPINLSKFIKDFEFEGLQRKIAISCGILDAYISDPSLENTKLLFHSDIELIEKTKQELRSAGYTYKSEQFFTKDPYQKLTKYNNIFEYVPEDIKQELGIDKFEKAKNYDNLPEDEKNDYLITAIRIIFFGLVSSIDKSLINDLDFWKYLLKNEEEIKHTYVPYSEAINTFSSFKYFDIMSALSLMNFDFFENPEFASLFLDYLFRPRYAIFSNLSNIKNKEFGIKLFANLGNNLFGRLLYDELKTDSETLIKSRNYFKFPDSWLKEIAINDPDTYLKIAEKGPMEIFKIFLDSNPEYGRRITPPTLPYNVDVYNYQNIAAYRDFWLWMRENHPLAWNQIKGFGFLSKYAEELEKEGSTVIESSVKNMIKIAEKLDSYGLYKLADKVTILSGKLNV